MASREYTDLDGGGLVWPAVIFLVELATSVDERTSYLVSKVEFVAFTSVDDNALLRASI